MARLLDKPRSEFTRSRPRTSNDNTLAETKNGAVVRKVFGYGHIPQRHASRFNTFCGEFLNPFVNFHRPCLFATEGTDPERARAHQARVSGTRRDDAAGQVGTVPEVKRYLREGITLEHLHQLARALSDVQAAEELNEARAALFKRVLARA